MDRVCQFYLRGRCARSNCEFKHVKPTEGGAGSSSIYRKTPCRFFEANGSCRFGDHCRFFHDASTNPERRSMAKVRPPIVDSDDDLPHGIDTDDDDESNVSGFTDYASLVGKKVIKRTLGGEDTKSPKNASKLMQDTKNATPTSASDKKEVEPKKPPEETSKVLPRSRRVSVNEGSSSVNSNVSETSSLQGGGGMPLGPSKGASHPPGDVSRLVVARKSVPPLFESDSSSTVKSQAKAPHENTSKDLKNTNSVKDNPKKQATGGNSTDKKETSASATRSRALKSVASPKSKTNILKASSPGNIAKGSPGDKKKSVLPKKNEGSNGQARRSGVTHRRKQPPLGRLKSERNKKAMAIRAMEKEDPTDESSEWSTSTFENSSDEPSDSPPPERTSLRIKKRLLTHAAPRARSNRLRDKSDSIRCQSCKYKRFPNKACRRCEKLQKMVQCESVEPTQDLQDGLSQNNKSPERIPDKEPDSVHKNIESEDINKVSEVSTTNTVNAETELTNSFTNNNANATKKPEPPAEKPPNPTAPEPPTPTSTDAASKNVSNICVENKSHDAPNTTSNGLELPKFDPSKFKPGYIPPIVKKGDEEYAIVVTGVKNTGLCGKYWGDLDNLPPRRKRRLNQLHETEEPPLPSRPIKRKDSSVQKVTQQFRNQNDSKKNETQIGPKRKFSKSSPKSSKKGSSSVTCSPVVEESKKPRRILASPEPPVEVPSPSGIETKSIETQTENVIAISNDIFPSSPSSSPVVPMNKERFAPYDDNRWFNIGKDLINNSLDAVQYTRSLRLPYHLLSFIRIKGNSIKGISCTDKNNMVFVVIEGEVSVAVETRSSHFEAKKGDSFFIPPKNNYNIINNKAREAELCIFQFAHEDSIPTMEQNVVNTKTFKESTSS